MLTGSCLFYIKSVHWVQGAGIGPAQGPCCFFSRPLRFPVTQSYLISWTAAREEDPGVLMLIRAVGWQLAGLEEPERRQETQSNTVTENLLQQAERHEGNEMWNCIWSDFEICRMSRGILIEELWVVLHAGQHFNFIFLNVCSKMVQLSNSVCLCSLGNIIPKSHTEMCWKGHVPFRVYLRLIFYDVYSFSL